jgi:hypothetical protein
MKDFEKYASENGFVLRLGRWDFVYTEGQRQLTLPVEMLADGPFLWELSRSSVHAWDKPHETEQIDESTATTILERIARFVELTGKQVRIC